MLWMLTALAAGCGGMTATNRPDAPPTSAGDALVSADDGGPCAASGATAGDYALTWSCASGCDVGAPFAYYDRLSIGTDLTLAYSRSTCASCEAVMDTGSAAPGGCVAGQGIPLGNGGTTAPYKLCPTQCGFKGMVSWTRTPGPGDASVWSVQGGAL